MTHPILPLYLLVSSMTGVTVQTENFVVTAESAEVADTVAAAAEDFRMKLALEWLDRELSPWEPRCILNVVIEKNTTHGLTTSQSSRNGTIRWQISVTGTVDRILDSVLPHELSHTILASRFERPLPRWADEGAAMLAESECEQKRQRMLVLELVNSRHRTPLRQLLRLKEYPQEWSAMLAVYGMGHSLSEFLIESGGREQYLEFLQHAQKRGWDSAARTIYGFADIESLEQDWLNWVRKGTNPPKTSPVRVAA